MTTIAASVPVLRWAAQRARLQDSDLIARFPKWPLWLSRDAEPTLKQLEDFARLTHTAIGYFFLPQPPALALPVPDFRTLRDEALAEPSSDLLDTLYLCQQRQDWYRDHARTHGLPALPFVGSASVQDAPEAVAQRMRETLGLSTAARRQLPTWADALRQLIAKAEEAGLMVMVSSVVGSNSHRKLDVGEFRGFALADSLAPLVFLNGGDSKAAQMFTLAHELAHVWLGATGVSDTQVGQVPEQQAERWCNQVAAELLMPLDKLRVAHEPNAPIPDEMQRLAREFKVSTLVALRRLFDAGYIGRAALWQHYRDEQERLRTLKERSSSGGDFYRSLGARTSKRFARAIVSSTLEGLTSFPDAFRMLGVRKTGTFYEAARELGGDVLSYLLDANVFMSAKNLHYGLDFCPAFWDWLVHQGNTGSVFSIDKVADEIEAGQDELSDWARDHGQALFRRTPPALAPQFTQVSTWSTGQQYTPAAINTFLQAADFYLIAHALAGHHVVVTHEVPSNSPARIKIPNVCVGLGVRFMTPYQMLRIERARFELGAHA